MRRCGLHLSGSEYDTVAGSCENSDVQSGSMNGGYIFDKLSGCLSSQ
jgi:hypothetical protein